MQHVVDHIFAVLGGSAAIARGIGSPPQTVHDWKNKGAPEIPPWRRSDVLDFARREGKLNDLSPESLAYLNSRERTVGKAAA